MSVHNESGKSPKKAKKKRHPLSVVSVLHYTRLVYRSILFLTALGWYLYARFNGLPVLVRSIAVSPLLLLIWGLFMMEMGLRFFPSVMESPGCQKQFPRNYRPTGRTDVRLHDNNAVMIVALVWILMNGIIGAMYMIDILDEWILMLICLLYSVCDMICILFFCPFQTWFLKNRCCSSCRIYNWDYAMMFTPLFFIPSVYTWTLLAAAVVLMVRWEITVWRYPERFSENTNQYLACANCTERLCTHKSQLKRFRAGLNSYAEKQTKRILSYWENKKE